MAFSQMQSEDRLGAQPEDAGGLQNYWYAAVASSRLRDKPLASNALGRELVVFRDARGVARALRDRCCHRGARLSLGEVEDGLLVCRYHGWRFDGEGACVHIPSLGPESKMKRGFNVPVCSTVEQDGYVWVRGNGAADAGDAPARIDGFDGHSWTQGAMPFACDWLAGIENNLDWCHAAFAHGWRHPHHLHMRVRGLQKKPYELRRTPTGLVMFAPITQDASAPIPQRALRIHFDLPNRIRFCPAGETPLIVLHFVPTGPGVCRLEWSARRFTLGRPKLSWSNRPSRVFEEDRTLLESAQPWYDREGREFERSVEADAGPLLARRIVELVRAGKWDRGPMNIPERRIVQVWA